MPMRRDEYPPDWNTISRNVKIAAGWRCEACGIKHGTLRKNAQGEPFREVLTTAHLGTDYPDGRKGSKEDRMDCRTENLACLCSACHLNFDRPENIPKRLKTLRERKLQKARELYQTSLFEEVS